jgi:hypothetical protein
MNFSDIKQDTPRLVVMFHRPAPDQERFQWGIVGKLPILSLIGYLTRVQNELPLLEPGDERHACPQSALVITWGPDPGAKDVVEYQKYGFNYFVHHDIPVDSLVGMMETIKAAMVGSQLAQQARDQQVGIVGPDGHPMRR